MHETLVVQEALALVLGEATRQHATRVTAIRMHMGDLEGIGDDALRAAFELFAEGTPAAGAVIEVEHVRARLACERCGRAPEHDVHGHEGVPHERCACGGRYRVLAGAGWSVDSIRAVT